MRLFFFNGTLKRVFTFVSPLFVCYTSPLGYMDSAKKEYNRQSRLVNQGHVLLRLWILSFYQAAC